MKVLAQLGQYMETNEFKRFDYGSAEQNEAAYGQPEPPHYDPARIQSKKIIFVRSVGNDWLSTREDQHQLINTMTGEQSGAHTHFFRPGSAPAN